MACKFEFWGYKWEDEPTVPSWIDGRDTLAEAIRYLVGLDYPVETNFGLELPMRRGEYSILHRLPSGKLVGLTWGEVRFSGLPEEQDEALLKLAELAEDGGDWVEYRHMGKEYGVPIRFRIPFR